MKADTCHGFADESMGRGRYSMAVALVPSVALAEMRKSVRGLLLPGQSRLHMAKESASRQRHLARAVSGLGIEVLIVSRAHHLASERENRDRVLAELIGLIAERPVERLSIESCDQDRQDRVVVANALNGRSFPAGYHHMRPSLEPLLWLPDIVAWSHGKGGEHRKLVAPLLARHLEVA